MGKRGRKRRERDRDREAEMGGRKGEQGKQRGRQGNGGDRRDLCVTGKVHEKDRKIMFPVFRIMLCSQCE